MDALRLAIEPVGADAGGGFAVQIYVNEVEVTSRGAGLGMDPYDVLVPVNRFEAREDSQVVPVARCDCGVYGCGMTDAAIVRSGDTVRWDWLREKPMARPITMDADAYDREVRRAAGDHSWETPERTAGRLILSGIQPSELPRGLRFGWVGNDWRDPGRFEVSLNVLDTHQVFVSFEWLDHSPESLAAQVRELLTTRPPSDWPASWHSIHPGGGPPAMASRNWTQKRI